MPYYQYTHIRDKFEGILWDLEQAIEKYEQTR